MPFHHLNLVTGQSRVLLRRGARHDRRRRDPENCVAAVGPLLTLQQTEPRVVRDSIIVVQHEVVVDIECFLWGAKRDPVAIHFDDLDRHPIGGRDSGSASDAGDGGEMAPGKQVAFAGCDLHTFVIWLRQEDNLAIVEPHGVSGGRIVKLSRE